MVEAREWMSSGFGFGCGWVVVTELSRRGAPANAEIKLDHRALRCYIKGTSSGSFVYGIQQKRDSRSTTGGRQ